MRERIQEPAPETTDEALPSLPSVPTANELGLTLEALRRAPLDPELAAQLNQQLEVLPANDDAGRLVLGMLSDGSLTGAADTHGRQCRAEAVKALLRLGYPWALEIDPETLAWFRSTEAPKKGTWKRLAMLLGVLIFGAGSAAYLVERGVSDVVTEHADGHGLNLPSRFETCVKTVGEPLKLDLLVRVGVLPTGVVDSVKVFDSTGNVPMRVPAERCFLEVAQSVRGVPSGRVKVIDVPVRAQP